MTGQSDGRRDPLVLLVDDDPMLRLLAREALELVDLRVEERENGAQALEAFAALRPDLIVMDVMMPEIDGFDTCAALRRMPGGATVPVLIMTGLDDLDSVTRAYHAGATDFVSKPINGVLLGHRVRYMLRASRAVEALRASEARLAHAQHLAGLGDWSWDLEQRVWQCSDEVYRLLGTTAAVFGGTYDAYLGHVHPEDQPLVADQIAHALRGSSVFSFDHRLRRTDGTELNVHQQGEVIRDALGRAVRLVGVVQDVTERRRAEERIHYLANYDSLTSLPNRRLLQDGMTQLLQNLKRQDRKGAVLLLNLDRFKRINDTLGRGIGDDLLRRVSERVVQCVRRGDTVTRQTREEGVPAVSRPGGDEFTILLAGISSPEDPTKVARRLLTALAQPIMIEGHELVLTASIGISLFPEDGTDADTLLRNADAAMYRAKERGGDRYQFYSETMNAGALQRLALESSLRKALDRGQLEVHYQPQVNLAHGAIVGVEALVRWRHPDLGMVSPAEFIPLAEETGLIGRIGEWVLRTACLQQKAWQREGLAPLRMAVNLSSLQFSDEGLIEVVSRTLRETEVDPQDLELELTEGLLMEDGEKTVRILHDLKQMGIRLVIDDFGTGYSSLSYLRRFPLETLKIDRSFVKDLTTNVDNDAVTAGIIALAHNLNLRIVAEGVETPQQLSVLRERGCHEVQGYLFSRPVPAEDLARFLLDSAAGLTSAGRRLSTFR